MKFERGDIVEFDFHIPDINQYVKHPGLIISNDDVYGTDECYIMVMMTTSERRRDMFSFEVTDDMLHKPSNKANSQIRLHLVTYVPHDYIKGKPVVNRMKKNSVDRVVANIHDSSLSILDF